ncbi:FkbM family methyltransferase [Aporhodopirellula aestuarii]|uniref:FkbM family methyltransferase n=1 Tax=Aporhodopirellula aestuarii TaxID=2950107 RepID=A0ABT0UAD5_9BACT|nr:FkbM family methyltransferase [Aporhodopirellula aestuarii]MCM2373863.1 FkbM family methyltransferase [Aporhodopirellula aestuarii]
MANESPCIDMSAKYRTVGITKAVLQSFVRPAYGGLRRWIKSKISDASSKEPTYKQQEIIDVRISGIPYPIKLRTESSDGRSMTQCLIERQYNIDPGFEPSSILDLGGNIGCSAIYFANRWPNAKIVVVEPFAETFAILKENVSGYPNVVAVQAAAHYQNETVSLDVPSNEFWSTRVLKKTSSSDNAGNVARGVTVSDLLDEHGIDKVDILKMDIEGSEADLFANRPHSWLRRTRLLMIELHDGTRMGCTWYLERALRSYKTRKGQIGENLLVWFDEN